ncbi:hypothetical protein GGF46_005381 [Coemansia sp. RSA 552]|nr:hypothetical protein GGF46_005381 [Coemansia sp. RSA 552]
MSDVPSHVVTSGVLNSTAIFGYTYESGIDPASIQWDSLTHLVLAFFAVDGSGSVSTNSKTIGQLVAAAHKNNVKVLASIGGDGDASVSLAKALGASASRTKLANSLVAAIKAHKLDGIDYDLEFPETPQQINDLYLGLNTMRAALDASFEEDTKTLTMTLYSSNGKFGPKVKQVDAKPFSDLVDFGLLMSYDYFGSFSEISAPNSPFYDVKNHPGLSFTSSIDAWLRAGWDAEKLVAGMPFYGRTSIVMSAGSSGTQFMKNTHETPPSGPISKITGAWTWADLRDPKNGALSKSDAPQSGWQRFWDNATMTPWLLHSESQTYIGYDDPDSLTVKANHVIRKGLGGLMVWMVQYDYKNELSSVVDEYSAACNRIARQARAEQDSLDDDDESSDSDSDESSDDSDDSDDGDDSDDDDDDDGESNEGDDLDDPESGASRRGHPILWSLQLVAAAVAIAQLV